MRITVYNADGCAYFGNNYYWCNQELIVENSKTKVS